MLFCSEVGTYFVIIYRCTEKVEIVWKLLDSHRCVLYVSIMYQHKYTLINNGTGVAIYSDNTLEHLFQKKSHPKMEIVPKLFCYIVV